MLRHVRVLAIAAGLFAALQIAGPATSQTRENNINRNGANFANFDLPRPDPELCRSACAGNPNCLAYTYVRPGYQGPKARCWLKNPAPAPAPDGCCVSGVKAGTVVTPGLEFEVNRPGSDYRDFVSAADPGICRAACLNEKQCRSFTYVKPGVQGPQARCWLKNAVPAPRRDGCCTSGRVR